MKDDIMPANNFEREMKKTKGIRFFREYRRKLAEEQDKEKELWKRVGDRVKQNGRGYK